jgi:hypothetical protein
LKVAWGWVGEYRVNGLMVEIGTRGNPAYAQMLRDRLEVEDTTTS